MNEIGTLRFLGFANDNITIQSQKKALADLITKFKNEVDLIIKNLATRNYNPEIKNQIKYYSDIILRIDKYIK